MEPVAGKNLSREELDKLREIEPPRWAMLVFGVIMALAVAYAFHARTFGDTFGDIVAQSLPVGIAVGAVLLLIAIGVLASERPRVTAAAVGSAIILVPVLACGAFLTGVMFYAIGAGLYDFYLWTRTDLAGAPEASTLWTVLVVAAPLAVGVFLFGFRFRLRAVYGLSEAAVGLWIASERLSEGGNTSSPADLVLTTASVYLMVRGFDNIHQGLTKDPIDPVAAKVIEWLRQPWRV